MIRDSQLDSWNDRGRLPLIAAVVLTILAASYVILTTHVTTPVIPVVGSIAGLAGSSRRSAVALRAIGFAIVFLFSWLGLASVGLFFAPGALAMLIALVRT
jgi:hypothetical protein